jgi:cytochrome P450
MDCRSHLYRGCRYRTCPYNTLISLTCSVSFIPFWRPQTVSTIYSFFRFMTVHPELQARAQAELDAVIGLERLPALADRSHLPFMNALLKETLRCALITPLCPPHLSRVDDIHDGYFIPKNTMVMPNL